MSLSEKSEDLKTGSQAEARRLGHRYVGTEHILLAVSRESQGRVGEILIKLDLDQAKNKQVLVFYQVDPKKLYF